MSASASSRRTSRSSSAASPRSRRAPRDERRARTRKSPAWRATGAVVRRRAGRNRHASRSSGAGRLRLIAARLDHVLAALRARARAYDETPDALQVALADFPAQLESTRARMDSDGSPGSQGPSLGDPGGGGHRGEAVPEIAVAALRQRGDDVRPPAPVTRRTTRTPRTPRR
jgi:hypothetical protein